MAYTFWHSILALYLTVYSDSRSGSPFGVYSEVLSGTLSGIATGFGSMRAQSAVELVVSFWGKITSLELALAVRCGPLVDSTRRRSAGVRSREGVREGRSAPLLQSNLGEEPTHLEVS